jgi:flagellin
VQLSIGAGTIDITTAAGFGDYLNGISDININFSAAGADATYAAGVLTVSVTQAVDTADLDDVAAAIAAEAEFASAVVTGNETISAAEATAATASVTTVGRLAGSSVITISSVSAGAAANGKTVTIVESAAVTTSAPTATVDGSGNITVTVNDTGTTDLDAVTSAIDALDDYSATLATTTGDGNYNAVTQAPPAVANTAGGAAATGGITEDLVFELGGADGSEVFSVLAGASITELAAQVNLVSDATGVTATVSGTTLELKSSAYGSAAFVDLSIISEGTGTVPSGTFTTAVGAGSRQTGTDVSAKINGIDANGSGNRLSINTATLDLTLDVTPGFIGNTSFTITGGGALFQLGPDVVSNQQARLGIRSVNTARLGGASGLLYQLASGEAAELSTGTNLAAEIVEEAIDQVTTLRGRLGAFQRTLLETNKNALNDTLVNLTDAESQIRDADFAAETAALTRAQILVQSGTTVLQIANQNPQNVLALLR